MKSKDKNLNFFFLHRSLFYFFYYSRAFFAVRYLFSRYAFTCLSPGAHSASNRDLILPIDRKIKILFVGMDKFRGEQDILSSNRMIEGYGVSPLWQSLILARIPNIEKIKNHFSYINSRDGSLEHSVKTNHQEILQKIISPILKKYSFDVLISPNHRYKEDYDWGVMAKKIGIRVIVMFRENLSLCNPGSRCMNDIIWRHKMAGTFHGDYILTHTRNAAYSILESGYSDKSAVKVLGSIRMDPFIQKLEKNYFSSDKSKNILMFSFVASAIRYGEGVADLIFAHAHESFVKFASQNRRYSFIIKAKAKWANTAWLTSITRIIDKYYGNSEKEKINLRIDYSTNVHDLIIQSRAICAFDSTAVLESALANKRVLLFYFEEYSRSSKGVDFGLIEHLDLFDVVTRKSDFYEVLQKIIINPFVDPDVTKKRRALFSERVSDLSGFALPRYLKFFETILSNNANR